MGEFYLQFIFSFLGGFIFYVMAPLYLAHFDHLVYCNSGHGIDDLDRMLRICQIILHTVCLILAVALLEL
jgi:hypothetical protein